MRIKLFTASLLSLILIAGCSPYDPLREDFWVTNLGVLGTANFTDDVAVGGNLTVGGNTYTGNIYPTANTTYDVGSPDLAYTNGYFETLFTWNGTAWVDVGGIASANISAVEIAAWNAHPPLVTGVHGLSSVGGVTTWLISTGDYLRIGNAGATSHGLTTEDDLMVTGAFEVDGISYFDDDLFTDRWLSLDSNTFFGVNVAGGGSVIAGATDNTFLGHNAGFNLEDGVGNVGIGSHTLNEITTGDGNIAIGRLAGNNISTGNGNVFIGNAAGPGYNTNYGLYIDRLQTDTPLIGGNFTLNEVYINGELSMKTNQIHDVVDPTADQDAATKKYVDDSHIPIYYSPTSISVTGGTYTSGNLSSLTAIDGLSYVVTEGSGAPPVLTITAEFSGITNFHHIQWYSHYVGSPAHHVMAKLYNFTTASYIYLDDMSAEATFIYHSLQSPPMANYISGGVVRVQFDQIQNGVNTHTLLIDYLGLVD